MLRTPARPTAPPHRTRNSRLSIVLALVAASLAPSRLVLADLPDLSGVRQVHQPRAEHLNQSDILALLQQGLSHEAAEHDPIAGR